jgi:hypothetical protein
VFLLLLSLWKLAGVEISRLLAFLSNNDFRG